MTATRISVLTTALCLVVLTACSNGKFLYAKALGDISTLTGVSTGMKDSAPNTSKVAITDTSTGPPLIVGFKAIRVALPYAGDSGPSQIYTSPDGVVLAMNNGFVSRAIGLGIDMNGSYLPADSPWFEGLNVAATRGASTDRVIEYWKKGEVHRDQFRCTLVSTPREAGGTVVDESCQQYFALLSFINRYWLRSDNTIECSRQWIHPSLDPLQFFGTEQQAIALDLTKNGC